MLRVQHHVGVLTFLTFVLPASCIAEEFNYRNMLHARMKLDKSFDYEAHADSYMKVFQPSVHKNYRNDEFQFRRKLRETVSRMKDSVHRFSLETVMTLRTHMTIGGYDFEEQGFPVKEAGGANYYWYTNTPNYSSDLPSSYKIFLVNNEAIRWIPMAEVAAETFIARRKDRSGRINRSVYANIRFKIIKWREATNEFDVEIQSADFFADSARTRRIHSVLKKDDSKGDDKLVVANPKRE